MVWGIFFLLSLPPFVLPPFLPLCLSVSQFPLLSSPPLRSPPSLLEASLSFSPLQLMDRILADISSFKSSLLSHLIKFLAYF